MGYGEQSHLGDRREMGGDRSGNVFIVSLTYVIICLDILAVNNMHIIIIQINPFTKVYYRRGDPLYDDLMVLYGLDNVKDEEKSDPSKKVPDHGDSDGDSVEVTSPPFNVVSRRLFTGPSTSAARPPRGKEPRKPRGETDRTRCSSTSTSPLMWWKP